MSFILAFVAGALSILSPCVLPLAPIVIAGAVRDPRGPLALALGLALTFGVGGGIVASLGVAFAATNALRLVAAAIMVAAGLALLVPALGLKSERALSPLARFGEALAR